MGLRRRVTIGIVAGVALMTLSGTPAFADPPEEPGKPDGITYSRTIILRDGTEACGAGMGAPRWSGDFNPGAVSNAFLTGCHLTGPRTTEVDAGAVR